jgi:hypothetical protein
VHTSSPSRGSTPRRYVRLALTAVVALSVMAAIPAAGAVAAPAKKTSHRLAPPKVHPPKKPKRSARLKHRAPTARASLCSAPLVGDWHNINASTNAMTRAVVSFTCSDVILCDSNGNCSGGDSYYSTQMFGKCSPTDCYWGRVRAYPQYDGWIRATYNFGFKTSQVWLKSYSYYGLTYLRVWVYNDFTPSDGRTDYTTDEWFLR